MRFFTLLVLAGLTACSHSQAVPAAHIGFSIDQYLAVALEYQGPRSVAGVDTYGPTPKEFDCERSDAAGGRTIG